MEEINRENLLRELKEIKRGATGFFQKTNEIIGDEPEREFYERPHEREFFWNQIPPDLQKLSGTLMTRLVEVTPIMARATSLTPLLTPSDQHNLGHAIKGMRSALNLCLYRYWDTEVLHDEGDVLGVQAAGQSDDEGLHPARAIKIFNDCFRSLYGIVELVSPSSIEKQLAKKNGIASIRDIFIVHGHDDGVKEAVARFVSKLGLNPIILHEQPNRGRTIIEKFEDYAEVVYAIAILTPDDVGKKKSQQDDLRDRARQNCIFEFGYFIGKLGRDRVCGIVKDDIEVPSDYSGVLYIPFDSTGAWRMKLVKELKAIGIDVDANLAL